MYIISVGETTKEDVKKVYEQGENPNDFGCPMNWWLTLCTALPPSRLTNLRDFVGEEAEEGDEGEEGEEEHSGSELTALTTNLASPRASDMEEAESCPGLSARLGGGGVSMKGDFQALSQTEDLDGEAAIELEDVNPLGAVGDWDAAREADLETGLVEVGPMQGKALGHPLQIESRFKKVQEERSTLWSYFQGSEPHREELGGETFDEMILAVEADPNYDVEGLAGWAEANAMTAEEAPQDRARWELDFSVAVLLLKIEGYPLSTKVSIAFGEILLNAMP